ncbi:MAG: hypothetical protein QG588_780 [Candidatus Poribacteria bacterium]|nr:hypothetical protein [Candidatus Poribacteria bacterium]
MLKHSVLTFLFILLLATKGIAVEWEHVYECNNLPDDKALGDGVWEVFGTSGIGEITKNGEFHITDPADKVGFFMRAIDTKVATVEARVRVLSQAGVSYSLFLGIEGPADDAWVDLFPDRIAIDNGGPTHVLDMTKYHILRVTKDAKSKIVVYVDDEKVLDGITGGNSGRFDIAFGAGSTGGSSESYWDYVVYTTAGVLPPNELPNYILKSDVDVYGKLPVTWGKLKDR